MDFLKSIAIAASGLRAQAGRMRVHLREHRQRGFDRAGARRRSVPPQDSDLPLRGRPRARRARGRARPRAHRSVRLPPQVRAGPSAADANGNVKYPNVNSLIEMTDMREAQRSYEANINVIGATRRMIQRTLDILKA